MVSFEMEVQAEDYGPCGNCKHRYVCQYRDLFKKIDKTINKVEVASENGVISIKEITWIKPIKLECINFLPEIKETIRYGGVLS